MRKTLKEIRCEEDYEKDFVNSRCEKDNNITLYFQSTDVSDNEYTVDPTYLELGYLEPPLISNKSPGPDEFYLYKSYNPRLSRIISISNSF